MQADRSATAVAVLEPEPGEYGPAETGAMLRAIIRLFDRWGLSRDDAALILGRISPKTYGRWVDGAEGRVGRDLADRMSHLLGIHAALRDIFADPATGYRWMGAPNAAFGGRSALDLLRRGGMDDIVRLRRYLDAVRA